MTTQVTKVWWDGEKLMAEPIDPFSIYKEPEQSAQRTWVGLTNQEREAVIDNSLTPACVVLATEAKLKEKNNGN